MQRTLTFEGLKAEKRFQHCLTAILSAGDGKGARTREVLRSEARLLDAFDTISTEKQDQRVLNPSSPSLTLSQDDFALLSGYVDTTPWAPKVSREIVDLQDWLSAADKID